MGFYDDPVIVTVIDCREEHNRYVYKGVCESGKTWKYFVPKLANGKTGHPCCFVCIAW